MKTSKRKRSLEDVPHAGPPMCSLLIHRLEMQSGKVPSEHKCRLGQWYEMEEKRPDRPKLFWDIGNVHAQLHVLAKEIMHTSKRSKDPGSLHAMVRFKALWGDLKEMLDELRVSEHDG